MWRRTHSCLTLCRERPGRAAQANRRTTSVLAGGEETQITFINKSAGEIQLFWVNSAGDRISYPKVAAGERFTQPTYAGHVWVVRDSAGKDLAIFEAAQSNADAVIEPCAGDTVASRA